MEVSRFFTKASRSLIKAPDDSINIT